MSTALFHPIPRQRRLITAATQEMMMSAQTHTKVDIYYQKLDQTKDVFQAAAVLSMLNIGLRLRTLKSWL